MHVKLYNHNTLNYTYNALSQSAQKTYTALLTAGKKYRVSFDFGIDGITTASFTLSNGSTQVRDKLTTITTKEITEFTATATNLTLLATLSAGNYGRLAHIDNLEIAEIAEVGESYRFGFNGQEKDDEIAGAGNTMTAMFWEYDARLGRRWNRDPKGLFWESPYVCFSNSPIQMIDPNGDEVVNGDQLKADRTQSKIEKREKKLSELNISSGTTRREYLKSGGTKQDWNLYKKYTKELPSFRELHRKQTERAKITSDIIKRWALESPNIFNEVNQKSEKFILFSLSGFYQPDKGQETFGYNSPKSKDQRSYNSEEFRYIENAIDVYIDDRVKLSLPDIQTNDGYEYALNHEAGHWLYMIAHPEHIQYMIANQHKPGYKGGHGNGDPSGEKAKNYGLKKDIK